VASDRVDGNGLVGRLVDGGGGSLVEAAVGSMAVVVLEVLDEERRSWRSFQISVWSSSSARTVRTNRSAMALARGAPGGVLITLVDVLYRRDDGRVAFVAAAACGGVGPCLSDLGSSAAPGWW
jgi:hypothetical protein